MRSFSTARRAPTEFPPTRASSRELRADRMYSFPVIRPSGFGGATAQRDSIRGGAAPVIVDRVGVWIGKFAGSTRSFVPWTWTALAVSMRAPTRWPGAAFGAISSANHTVLGLPATTRMPTPRLTFPEASNRPFDRNRSVPGWRIRS